ncbi:hypothetical protein IAE22_29260, partial [Bacillus sp. S34]|nr:hypothetical protein [Bacillus sp. S34]
MVVVVAPSAFVPEFVVVDVSAVAPLLPAGTRPDTLGVDGVAEAVAHVGEAHEQGLRRLLPDALGHGGAHGLARLLGDRRGEVGVRVRRRHDQLRALNPEAMVTVAYGKLLR